MPLYRVYTRELYEACVEIEADSAQDAQNRVVLGRGERMWQDFLANVDFNEWRVRRVENQEEPEEEEEPEPALNEPPLQEQLAEVWRQANHNLANRVMPHEFRDRLNRVQEPEPAEDVDFEG